MSAEALIEETTRFIQSADDAQRERLKLFIEGESRSDSDWWDDLPEEVQASIERGIREADADEGGITWEAFKAEHPQWFSR